MKATKEAMQIFTVIIDQQSNFCAEYETVSFTEKDGEVIVGQYFAYNFYDTLKPDGRNYVDRWSGGYDEQGNLINVPDPFFDIMGDVLETNVTASLNRLGFFNALALKSDLRIED